MKVLLFRKELKNLGQLELVKLLPKFVSKGLGSGSSVGAGAVKRVAVEAGDEPELLDGARIVEGKGVATVE